MKKYLYIGIAGMINLCTVSPVCAEATDSLHIAGSESLGTQYTISLKGIRFKAEDKELGLRVSRSYNEKSMGINLIIRPTEVLALVGTDTTVIAQGWEDGQQAHDYTVVRNNSMVQVFRDKILFAKVSEKLLPYAGAVTLFHTGNIEDTYTTDIIPDRTEAPVEAENETAITQMLPEACNNLITDPYCNRGFTRKGLNASERTFYTQQAIYNGWGQDAYMDTDAYSGKYCIRLNGQGTYPDKGASLEVSLNCESGTPYYIRAMIKSDGYTGKLALDKANNFIRITDTQGKWKQVEGILTPAQASSLLSVSSDEDCSNGTLWIDNIEVYKGWKSTGSIGLRTEVSYVMLAAGTTWAPTRETNVYMLGFTDNGTSCSLIDTTKVHMRGGSRLKKRIAGSQLYSMYFPGDLSGINMTGYFDGVSYADTELEYGVDYVLQRYEYPRFHYINPTEDLTKGCYLIQFVDNMDGADVTLTFSATTPATTSTDKPYYTVGNPYGTYYTPKGRFYKFDEKEQRFLLTENQSLKPFEAYIATDATVPVTSITPNGIETGVQRVFGTDGSKISIRTSQNSLIAYASEPTTLPVYSVNGHLIKTVSLRQGENTIPLQRGFYLAGKKKVVVK